MKNNMTKTRTEDFMFLHLPSEHGHYIYINLALVISIVFWNFLIYQCFGKTKQGYYYTYNS